MSVFTHGKWETPKKFAVWSSPDGSSPWPRLLLCSETPQTEQPFFEPSSLFGPEWPAKTLLACCTYLETRGWIGARART